MKKYDASKIEKKWQKKWDAKKTWKVDSKSDKPKYYCLVEFPFPSGDGLHIGHVRSYTALDVIARKRRMEGFNVLYPIGWDAFGLPTENYAIKQKVAPQVVTEKNTDNFRRQLKALGLSFDWSREINTTDPEYYKWTQLMFLEFFKQGLAYKASLPINWCPKDKIGLANEEVVNGRCDRCGELVERRVREQWMLKITAYADKLLKGLKDVDFLPEIKAQQTNWIGKSEGREIDFKIDVDGHEIKVFTTRPDTVDLVTYLVLAPEHLYLHSEKIKNKKEVLAYVEEAKKKSERERQENKEKTGVELLGVKAVNPYNHERVPVFVADYVLSSYGTGAVMAVPAHDERDREFSETYHLSIKTGALLDKKDWPGKKKINYKLRDWVFSRQRYWGEPIPIIKCERCGFVPVPEKDLPVVLPKVKNYEPRDDGESPLASEEKWVEVDCPKCACAAKRETDTMPNWAGSSWYFLAYVMKELKDFSFPIKRFADVFKYWMPVDWYNGGMEHVTLHLLYSRFWNNFLFDQGWVPMAEPYKKRTAHGFILGEGGVKMSKSKGNVVNPDSVIAEFGADSLRMYEMFIGPFSEAIPWDSKSLIGLERFILRIYDVVTKRLHHEHDGERHADLERLLHQTIKKVSEDIEETHFNTAISALMIYFNELEKQSALAILDLSYFSEFIKLVFPFAPHLASELFEQLGNEEVLDFEIWPKFEEAKLKEEVFDLVIQVNGKVRAVIKARTGISPKDALAGAKKDENVMKYLNGFDIKKTIFVKNKLINILI